MTEDEDLLATIVEQVLLRDEGRELGPRREHNHNDGVGLSIDLTYDEATPPVAMELTSVQDDSFLRTVSYVRKIADELSRLATSERLGAWEVVVSDRDLSALPDVVMDVVRSGREVVTATYTSDDLIRWEKEGRTEVELGLRRRLEEANVSEVRRLRTTGNYVAIATWGESEGAIDGILDLTDVVTSNIDKIRRARREGHLVVGVGRFRTSADPQRTPLPHFPSGLDRLWLIRLWHVEPVGYEVWSARPDDRDWLVHEPVRMRRPRQ